MSVRRRLGCLLVLAVLAGCVRSSNLDEPARDFTVRTLSHGSVTLSELEGRVVLLNFWGTWCGPCRAEVPGLVDLHAALESRGLTILALDVGDEPEGLQRFVADNGMLFPVAPGEDVARLYGVSTFPTNIVVDWSGRLRHKSVGSLFGSVKGLRRVIEELLEEPAAAPSSVDASDDG